MFDGSAGDWREVALDQVCRIAIGGTPSRAVPRYWSDAVEGYPWTSIADLKSSRILETKEYISRDGVENSNVKLVPRGTVVMSFKLTIGRTAIADCDLYTNEAIAAFTPKEGLDRDFLFYWLPYLAESAETDQAIKGVTLNKEKLLAMSGLLPPLDEQQRIAEVLRSVDYVVATANAVFAQERVLKDKLAECLFRNGLRKSEQKETEIGKIPGHWQLLELREITESITVGIASSATHAYRDIGIPLIRNQNIKAGHLDLSDLLFVSPEYDESYASKRLRVGDVITMRTGYPGKSAVVPEELAGCQTFTTLISRPNQSLILPRFLCEWINSDLGMREVGKRQAGGAQQNLNAGALKHLPVPVPPLDEQVEIAAILNSFPFEDVALEPLLAHRATVRADLLSGRVRVPA